MTEEEAKKKICPQMLAIVTPASIAIKEYGASDEDVDKLMDQSRCIASDCMMWRQYPNVHGYCGLGGKL